MENSHFDFYNLNLNLNYYTLSSNEYSHRICKMHTLRIHYEGKGLIQIFK